jgi:hypothetical protein
MGRAADMLKGEGKGSAVLEPRQVDDLHPAHVGPARREDARGELKRVTDGLAVAGGEGIRTEEGLG